MSDTLSDQLFRSGQYEQAAARLSSKLKAQGEGGGRDGLLFLLDIGLSYHSAGRYEDSIQAFLKADKLAEIKDYTSLSKEAGTLITSENIKDYPGEDFENVLINTYLALNYALLGNLEDALVELRRVGHKLELMVTLGKRKYKQSAFARYVSAIIYESQGNYNDAYVDYQKTLELMPHLPGLGLDLWRCARELSMSDHMERWDEEFRLTKEDHASALRVGSKSKQGELIVVYENGISPIKRPHPSYHALPKFYPRPNPVRSAEVAVRSLGNVSSGLPENISEYQPSGTTEMLENIESIAIENLDEKYGAMIAKKIAGAVVKTGLAYELERQTNSPLLGFAARMAMFASDQADLRSWNLLPHDLQILRIVVEPGTYQIKLTPLGSHPLTEKVVQVGAGQKVFVNYRYMP
jgi:hypothetical protein